MKNLVETSKEVISEVRRDQIIEKSIYDEIKDLGDGYTLKFHKSKDKRLAGDWYGLFKGKSLLAVFGNMKQLNTALKHHKATGRLYENDEQNVISEVRVGKAQVIRLPNQVIDRFDGLISKSTVDSLRKDVIFFQDEGFDESEIVSYFAYLASKYI